MNFLVIKQLKRREIILIVVMLVVIYLLGGGWKTFNYDIIHEFDFKNNFPATIRPTTKH